MMFCILAISGGLVEVDPLGGEASIKELLPSDFGLITKNMFKVLGETLFKEGWTRPVLKTKEEETSSVRVALPSVAMVMDSA